MPLTRVDCLLDIPEALTGFHRRLLQLHLWSSMQMVVQMKHLGECQVGEQRWKQQRAVRNHVSEDPQRLSVVEGSIGLQALPTIPAQMLVVQLSIWCQVGLTLLSCSSEV